MSDEIASTSGGAPKPEQPRGKKGPIDWALSPFAEVRAGEGVSALLLMVNVFVLLMLYYFLKPVRQALMQAEYGQHAAEYISYASAGQALLLIPVVSVYSWIGKRVGPIKLITLVTLFFASNLVIFYVLAKAGTAVALAYFIWLGIFNNTVIAQFWAFANDTYSPDQGKRLFAIVGIGGSVGAIVGSGIVKRLEKVLTTEDLMLLATGGLVVGLGLTWAAHRVADASRGAKIEAKKEAKKEEPLGAQNGFAMLARDPYLLFIGIATLLLNFVNTNGEFILNQAVEPAARAAVAAGEAANVKEFSKAFYNEYYLYVNFIGFAVQSLLVSRIFKYVGVRWAMFIVPVLALGAYSTVAFVPLLAAIRVAKIGENSADYSIQNTTKQALWLITPREAKYKAKAAIDTFVVRIGDLASAGLVAAGTALHLVTMHFALANVVLVLIWLGILVVLSRLYQRRSEAPTIAGVPLVQEDGEMTNVADPRSTGDKSAGLSRDLRLALMIVALGATAFLAYRFVAYERCLARCDQDCESVRGGFAGGFRGPLCESAEESCRRGCTFWQ